MFRKTLILFASVCLLFVLFACDTDNGGDSSEQLAALDAKFESIFDELALPESTMSNMTFKTTSTHEPSATIRWLSKNQVVVTNRGEVRRQDANTTVTIDAMVTLNGVTRTRGFDVTIQAVDTFVFGLDAYVSDYGFASLIVSNRLSQAGSVVEVATEIEFLDALSNQNNRIIKITEDLNMGYYNVVRLLEDAGKTPEQIENFYTDGSFYRMNQNAPTLHPILLEEGVGQLIIQDRQNGLMIYSDTGITIRHLTSQIKTSKDVVVRNIHFTGIWEWDDDFSANYDELDWDYFTIETSDGVWLDHLSFDQAYDGIIDVKGFTSNMTFSYLWMDFQVDDFMRVQFDWLEENFLEGGLRTSANSRYVRMREDFNISKEHLQGYSAMQKKGFNLGNTTMGAGFDTITITIHHVYARNLADRLPRLRQGDVHMYNVVLDHTDIKYYREVLAGTGTTMVSQGIVPTENGSVYAENIIFINVAEPIKTHQDNIMDPAYTGRFKIKDSIIVNGVTYYNGSSYEGETGQDPFTPWKQTNTNMPRIPFYFRNYQSLPYRYNTGDFNYVVPAENISRVLKDPNNFVGPGVIEGLNWLEIRRIYSNPISPLAVRGHRIDADSIEIDDALIEMGTTFVPANPQVNNFYLGGPNYVKGVDYSLEIDDSNVNTDQEGEYEVTYTFRNLHEGREWDVVVMKQAVYVYDADKANEIYAYNLTNEFNSHVDFSYNVYTNSGTLYYAFSSVNNLTLDEVSNLSQLESSPITHTSGKLENLLSDGMRYLYVYTERDGMLSELVKVTIVNEIIVYINNIDDLNAMITSINSRGRYYILTTDIDLSEGRLDLLSTANVFSGVFDGNGYTLHNLERTVLRGGLFMTINGGMIKNLTIDNVHYTVDSLWRASDENPDIMLETKPADDAGILATYVYVSAIFDNITIKNSSVNTNRNYAAALIGRVRTGQAFFSNIKILDVEIHALVTAAKYTGGLIGGGEPNTKIFMNDIYVNGLTITHQQSDMIGVVIGRVRAYVVIENIVLLNVEVTGRHNLGMAIGKEDNTTTLISITNYLSDVNITFQPDPSGVFSDYYGYVIGNPDAGKATVQNYFVTFQENFNMGRTKGLNTVTAILPSIDVVDALWWETNLPAIFNSDLWEIGEDGLAYLK